MAAFFKTAYGLSDGQTSQLAYIRRGTVYACVTIRSDMLAALPIKGYRLGNNGRGRKVDVTNPAKRLGMPLTARGMRVADAGTVTEVEGSELVRRVGRPNEDMTGLGLMRMTEMSLGLAGQSYWRMHGRGATATKPPQEIGYVRHDRVTPERASEGDSARTIKGWFLDPGQSTEAHLPKGEMLWLRYPDPNDPDYGVLAPTDIAKLGADSYQDAMSSNRDMFRRGLTPAGMVLPPEGVDFFSDEQMDSLDMDIGRRFTDKNSRHRLAIMKYRFGVESLDMVSPKEAEFVALMEFAIEDTARVYRVPIEFVGGTRRTYQNTEAAHRGIWMMALEPEATWLGDELSMRLAPMFGDEVDFVALDMSNVVALQEDEQARWGRHREMIEAKVETPDEYRTSELGLDELGTGAASVDSAYVVQVSELATQVAAGTMPGDTAKAIITGAMGMSEQVADAIIDPAAKAAADKPAPVPAPPPVAEPDDAGEPEDDATEDAPPMDEGRAHRALAPEYGGEEHARIMGARAAKLTPHEKAVGDTVGALMAQQQKELLAKMDGGRSIRMTVGELATWFSMARWVREFRNGIKPDLANVVGDAGALLYADVGAAGSFDPNAPPVLNFLRNRAQRFAEEVNATTWDQLRRSLADGIAAGDHMSDLKGRVTHVMGGRIRSSAENIARTEVLGAFSGGSQIAAEATGLRLQKTWLSAMDTRVRADHRDAHGQQVGLNEDFEVGGASGPGPGMMGEASQDCQCRCTVTYEEASGRVAVQGESNAIHAIA